MQAGLKNTIHKALVSVLGLILPRYCAGCGKEDEAFCGSCELASYKTGAQCVFCGFRNGAGKICNEHVTSPLKHVLWAGRYDGPLKEAIWQFKYKKRKELARPFAEMLWKKFCEINLKNAAPKNDFIIIPIPLHFKKEHERGFNQAELLAKEFSKLSNLPLLTHSLLKVKETKAQVAVENKELRIKNLENAFEAHLPPGEVAIILIDDVSTTGATLIHASEALIKAGIVDIIGLVVAHG